MQFLLSGFAIENQRGFYHNWKNGNAKNPAFLDDYAFLIQAMLHLQEITNDASLLLKAKALTEFVFANFSEEETGFFFFTGKDQRDVIIRKKEVYDGAVPSGNAVMLYNVHHLSVLFNLPEWRARVEKCISSLGQAIVRYPASFGVWACLLQEIVDGTKEIAVVGENFHAKVKQLLAKYIPHKVLMAAQSGSESFPLLSGKPGGVETLIYVCEHYSCLNPVTTIPELIKLLNYQE
jgi:uncharacterized protein YyaL (SSP411 family)